jgi:hypothetical protein
MFPPTHRGKLLEEDKPLTPKEDNIKDMKKIILLFAVAYPSPVVRKMIYAMQIHNYTMNCVIGFTIFRILRF